MQFAVSDLIVESDLEFIEDDETLDTSFAVLRSNYCITWSDSPEDLEQLTNDIRAHHARSHRADRSEDDSKQAILQPDVSMYTFLMPVSGLGIGRHQLFIYLI